MVLGHCDIFVIAAGAGAGAAAAAVVVVVVVVFAAAVRRRCLNSLEQLRYPNVAHRVFELFAVDVAFQLFGLLLDPGPPIVLDLIIGSSGQILCDFRPPKRN